MRYKFFFLFIILTLPLKAYSESDVEFILDISGSMTQKLNGVSQVELAKKALISALEEIDHKQLVALRVYGHRVDKVNKAASCKDTELLIPFKQLDKEEFKTQLNMLTPLGWTPIAYALEESRNDLLDVGLGREVERVIILMTDGEETCGGDPIAVLKKLKADGFKLTVHTVGFNVNDLARKQLKEIADFTGGKYFDAKDAQGLNDSFKEATKVSAKLLDKKKATYGEEVRGGDSYEQAAAISLDKEYKLDHHQKKDEFDYFYLDLKSGDRLNISLKTLEKGINIRKDGEIKESIYPYAGLQLHDAERQKIKKIEIIGNANKKEDFNFLCNKDGRYYLLLGSTYEDMNKDHVNFQISLDRKGDLGTTNDAGNSIDKALFVEAKRYEKNYLGDGDEVDMFSFNAKANEVYVVGVIPNAEKSSSFQVGLYNDFKERIYSQSSDNNAGLKSKEIKIPEDGQYIIEIKYDGSLVEYSLVLKKKEVVASETAPVVEGEVKQEQGQ